MAIIGGSIARQVIRAALPSLIRQGLSGKGIIGHFSSWGYGIRTQDFYKLFREADATVLQEDKVMSLDKFAPIPKDIFVDTGLNLSNEFLYDVEFDVYDEHGSYQDTKKFSYSSDSVLEPTEVEELMTYQMNETTSGEQGWQYVNATLTGALRRKNQ